MKPFKIIILLSLTALSSPALADFGCHFVVNSRLSTAIDGPGKKLAFRFTCQEDMNVIALSLYCAETKTPPAYLVSLQEDEGGKPSGHPLEASSVTPHPDGWVTIPLNETSLVGGKVYDLVVEQDTLRGGDHPVGIIGKDNFASFAYTDVLNPFYPHDESPDRKLRVLLFENNQWKEVGGQPLFALHGNGNRLQGNPYDSFGERPIHGNGTPDDPSDDVLQGEALHPHTGFFPKGFIIQVRKQGNPTTPLNYRVYAIQHMQHTTSLVYSGEALKPSQVSEKFQWVTIGFTVKDHPVDFPPECRYVVFQTNSGKASADGKSCEDCYLLSDVGNSGNLSGAPDLTFDGGAHLSRAVHSYDGWKTWVDEFERDAHVVIIGPPPVFPKTAPANPIPTPLPFFRPGAL